MCRLLKFQALSVEHLHIDGDDDKNSLQDFMNEKGYTVRAEITDGKLQAYDYLFVKKGFNEDIKLPNIHTKNGEVPILQDGVVTAVQYRQYPLKKKGKKSNLARVSI